jgi:acetyl esterase/lipase
MNQTAIRLLLLAATILMQDSSPAQSGETAAWTARLQALYRIVPDVVYLTASNWDAKLDIYLPRTTKGPVPTVIHIHGGGWVWGSKNHDMPYFLPYLEMGMAVVNIDYRLASVAPAPAAVEDCRCALHWVRQNADQYKFDTSRIVITGFSAGGHLSLTTGLLPTSAGLDRQCSAGGELPVAAVVNWYGITDVEDLLDGPNMKNYAVFWLGSLPDRERIARRVSPLTYIRPGLPPVLTIHGNADPIVPYSHAVRLHEALDRAKVPNRLLTVSGGKHGGFTQEELVRAYSSIREFLQQTGVLTTGGELRQ